MGRKTHQATLQLRGRLATGLLQLMALLSLNANRAVGHFIGLLLWQLNGSSRRVTETNLQMCFPEMPSQQRTLLARQSLIETAKGMTELGWVWHRPEQALALTHGGNTEFSAALETGAAVIVLAPHLGCWEVLNFWLAKQAPMHAMFLPSGIQRLDDLVLASREKIGSTMHPATARGVATLVRALKKGHSLTAILPDQVADRHGGRFADFYGQPAWTGTLSSKLIQQTGAQVFMAFAKRLPEHNGYQVLMQPADQGIYSDDMDTSLAALNNSIEALISEAPAQYLWSYKRFRRAPEGQAKPY